MRWFNVCSKRNSEISFWISGTNDDVSFIQHKCWSSVFFQWLNHSFSSQHKKWSFPWRISGVNVTKYPGNCGSGHIYWKKCLLENYDTGSTVDIGTTLVVWHCKKVFPKKLFSKCEDNSSKSLRLLIKITISAIYNKSVSTTKFCL